MALTLGLLGAAFLVGFFGAAFLVGFFAGALVCMVAAEWVERNG